MRKTISTLAIGGALALSTILPAQAATTLDCTNTGNAAQCIISGTTDQPTVTLPLEGNAGLSWPVGTYQMKSGAGVMIVTRESVTFTFSEDYLAEHDAPYTYSGTLGFRADAWGHEGPFTITLNGETYTYNPGGYCDEACRSKAETETRKTAWDNGDGTVGSHLLLGSTDAARLIGQTVTISDQAGPGQSECDGWLNEQQPDGTWAGIPASRKVKTGTFVSVDFVPAKATAYTLTVTCKIDGSQTSYTDTGVIAGTTVQASVDAVWADADGNGNNKSTPTPSVTPSAAPSETTTPEPTPTESATPFPSETPRETPSETPTPTPTQSATPESTPSQSATPTPTGTKSSETSSSPTPTPQPSKQSETVTPKPSQSSAPTEASAPTATATTPSEPAGLPHTGADRLADTGAPAGLAPWLLLAAAVTTLGAVVLRARKEN